jgi:hypothetical protein
MTRPVGGAVPAKFGAMMRLDHNCTMSGLIQGRESVRDWQSQLLYIYTNPSTGKDNFDPPSKKWPDLRLFADIGRVPILSEFSVHANMLHTAFLYGALLSAAEHDRRLAH